MTKNAVTEIEDERIVQLVSSGLSQAGYGNVEVCLFPEEEPSAREPGLLLTEDDALALVDVLRQAVRLVAGSEPQAFIRLLIHEPE